MFRHFEQIIDPFASDRLDQPPHGLFAFARHFVGQAWRPLAVALVVSGLLAMLNALVFVFVGVIVDRIGATDSPANFFADNLGLVALIVVLLLVVDPLLAILNLGIMNQALVPGFTNLIRWQTHRYVLRQSIGFFQNDFAGRISNKVMQTALALRRSVKELIDAIWQAGIFVITTLVVLADADLRLALPLLAWVVGYVVLLALFVPQIKSSSARTSEAYSNLMGRVVDGYSNILTVKLFGHAAREDAFAREGIVRQQQEAETLMRAISWLDLLVGIWNMIMVLGLGWLAITLWSVGHISVGAVATTLALALRINQMSFWIMFVTTSIAENIGIVRDGIDTISVPQTVVDASAAGPLAVPRGEIRFEAVSFHYGRARASDTSVIDGLSLTVAPGERVGLVGRSGAGKSTLVQLLLRLHDVEGGRIVIDGSDIAAVGQESLRAAIGTVTQDTSLLHRSVLDNIRYGRPEATLEAAISAARRAQAHEFIEGLVDGRGRRGYEAHVGERGVKLSGGQRQRIAIARALLKDAPILVLDEATSALDSEVEAALQEQLFNLMAGKTVIAIAHRLSTIAAMDRLVIMEDGRIVEDGSHQALVESGGLYARLWAQQSSGFVAA